MKFLKTFLASLLAGALIFIVLPFAIMMGLVVALPSGEQAPMILSESILEIDLGEDWVDSPNADATPQFDPQTMMPKTSLSLLNILSAIEAAESDPRIKGIYLHMNGGGTVQGTALLEEVRDALERFKQSGKFIVAYDETYSQAKYYMASVADKIYMQPQGSMEWMGLSSEVMFYKGLFDKLGVKVDIFRPSSCKYKSAVEPFFLDKMSAENRQQMQELIHSMWATISGTVAEARQIEVEKLTSITDNLEVTLASEALAHGFIDGMKYEDEMDDVFNGLGVQATADGSHNMVSLGSYCSSLKPALGKTSDREIAVVYADGEIVDGEGEGATIFGRSLQEKLREVRLDDRVKAVVLRVNSPGGSALASDVIWREMSLLRQVKPVVVSMGSYAASGGYYISSPADIILANRTTLTGSIGVFGMIPQLGEALRKNLGVTTDQVKSNREGGLSLMRPMSPTQRAALMRGVDQVYETFTGKVSEGRNLKLERVLEIAEGRVWSGTDAKQIGLIDDFGGLTQAIVIAKQRVSPDEAFTIREVKDEPSGLVALFSMLNVRGAKILGKISQQLTSPLVKPLSEEYRALNDALKQQGVVCYCPYRLSL